MFYRFFEVTEGPLIEAAEAYRARVEEVKDIWRAFMRKVGARDAKSYTAYGDIAGMVFDEVPPGWRVRHGGWWPMRTTREGKALYQEMKNLPRLPQQEDVLEPVGLSVGPVLITGSTAYRVTAAYSPKEKKLFVKVPWCDADPAELAEYEAQRGTEHQRRWDGNLDHLLWKPSPDMVEVKEWEFLRDIEEANNAQG